MRTDLPSPPSPSSLAVLGLVDLHFSGTGALRLPDLAGVDLVLLGGDLTHFRGPEVARRVVERIQEKGPRVLAVCGNCDRRETEDYLRAAGVGLDRRATVVEGVRFLGLSGGLPFGGCPYERTEDELAAALDELWRGAGGVAAAGPTVLVSHQPPHGTRCDLARGRPVGSTAVRAAIEEHQPDLVFCGHIHEAVGCDTIGKSRIVNPGPWRSGRALRFEVVEGKIGALELSSPS